MASLALTFNDVNFSPIQLDNQIWLTSAELAKGLDYSDTRSVTKIFNRNQDEFTDAMTQVVNLTTSNKNNDLQSTNMRIFSLRGCHLIAMFARTIVAKEFRKWVLDILDKEVGAPVVKTHKSERTPLHEAHALLVTKTKHLNVNQAWKLIHQRFNVNSIDEIPYDVIPVAVEYVHHLIAMYSSAEKKAQGSLFDNETLELVKDLVNTILEQNCMTSCLYRAAHAMDQKNGMYLAEFAFKTNFALLKLSRLMDLRGPHNRKLISDDLKTASYTTGNQHYGDRWFHPLVEARRLMGVLEVSGGLTTR